MSSEDTPLLFQPKLSSITKYCYGVGHILNDLCASIWFSYLLVYFHNVLEFNNLYAGYIMLIGQLADGIATPLVGYEVDKQNGCLKYGKRKTWHLLGCFCVLISFPFIFASCLVCSHSSEYARLVYYSPFVVIFQFGWATTQISHLSLIPQIAEDDEHIRVSLNAVRYTFTVLSSITVYLIAWILLGSNNSGSSALSFNDQRHFMILVSCVLCIGVFFSTIFHIGTKEKCNTGNVSINQSEQLSVQMRPFDWFKNYRFYQVLLLYMCARLIVNIPQVYLPIYLLSSLKLHKRYIAIVPLVVFISGFLTSLTVKRLNLSIGRKFSMAIGLLICIAYSLWIYFLRLHPQANSAATTPPFPHSTSFSPTFSSAFSPTSSSAFSPTSFPPSHADLASPADFETAAELWPVFAIACLIGAGSSVTLVTALAITADLIGAKSESGAFVYGTMSFSDKISNGIVILVIQTLQPCLTSVCCPACVWYYRQVISFTAGGVSLAAIFILLTLRSQPVNQNNDKEEVCVQ